MTDLPPPYAKPFLFPSADLMVTCGLLGWRGYAFFSHSRQGERAQCVWQAISPRPQPRPVPAVTSPAILSHCLWYPRQPTAPSGQRGEHGGAGRVSSAVTASWLRSHLFCLRISWQEGEDQAFHETQGGCGDLRGTDGEDIS